MENQRGLAALLALSEQKDTGIVLRVADGEKNHMKKLAEIKGLSLSDFIRDAVYYYTWATSDIELETLRTNREPEFIDLINKAPYPVYLANYLIADDTFEQSAKRTNKNRHSFYFGPLVFNYINGQYEDAILYPDQIVRVYSGVPPVYPPEGVSIWTTLPGENKIWNDFIDRVTIFRIAQRKSEDIIAGIPAGKIMGLEALVSRNNSLIGK